MTKGLILPPGKSAPANEIIYKHCPFCGAGHPLNPIPELRRLFPKMLIEGDQSCIICTNIKCGAVAPTYTWNNRYVRLELI